MTYRAMLVVLLAVLLLGALEDRSRTVSGFILGRTPVGPPPLEEQTDISTVGEAYDSLDSILKRFVSEDGLVNYTELAESGNLGILVRWFGRYGPSTHPDLFATRDDTLAYYINAYNTLVLWGVTRHWPIHSVFDVADTGVLSVKSGQGFFFSLRFVVDGQWINLYELEHDVIWSFDDARIHAAINCASLSCPKLRSQSMRPEGLPKSLNQAMESMVAHPTHLEVLHEEGVIVASAIFDWFRDDFESEGETLTGFWRGYATGRLAKDLERAEASAYEIRFVPYDWRLNEQ